MGPGSNAGFDEAGRLPFEDAHTSVFDACPCLPIKFALHFLKLRAHYRELLFAEPRAREGSPEGASSPRASARRRI
jgi:hypothetical protein